MSDDKETEASLEQVLRLLDEGELGNETEKRLMPKVLARWVKSHPPEAIKGLLKVADTMALYLSDDYTGKVSAAARKILANGPELTARARDFFLRMGSEIRKQRAK
jgi:hypothetical protein